MTAAVTLAALGNGPAFSAYMSANQTPSSNTWTTMIFDTEEFDTNSCFNTSTYTFTPTVAGYYQFNVSWVNVGSAASYLYVSIAKNGSRVKSAVAADATGGGSVNRSALIYMNGSTDYVLAQMYTNVGAAASSAIYSNFQGFLARSA
jgi:hypothetical protein